MFSRLATCFRSLLERRQGGAFVLVLLFIFVALATRLALMVRSSLLVTPDVSLLATFGWGLLFDLGAALLFAAPAVVVLALLPGRIFESVWGRLLAHVAMFMALGFCLFSAVAEWVFWDEFGARFNFIAVDYLVYTHEVIDNIRESYPMPWIVAGLGAATLVIYSGLLRTGLMNRWLDDANDSARTRWLQAAGWLGVTALATFALDTNRLPSFENNYNRELAKNGVWSLFAAFRNNELEYEQFYATLPVSEAFARIHNELSFDNSAQPGANPLDTLRLVKGDNTKPELRLNVIQITVESLSAEFVGALTPSSQLTPNLDDLAVKSLVFDNFYATGTRTDRGMEALTLSIPPTPGRSLVKRPHNENLFTLGSVFRSRGYDTAFIYGGYGYFDNMNYFFGYNGYRVVDRASVTAKDVTFANAWGACDGDLYQWTLREADRAYAEGKPFYHFAMTTSNHRPYSFPAGRIDLPSKTSGRAGAVKYTDYEIGAFLREAATRPWFKNTVFVIVADHCASSAGKTELPVQNYHIPLIIYAPGGQLPTGHIADIASQVDYAPTLLGLLNWTYPSRFFGWDLRHATGDRRALIGNYQKLGLYEPGMLAVLKPLKVANQYSYDDLTFALTPRPPDVESEISETIAYYQTASYLFRNHAYQALSPKEIARYPAFAYTGNSADDGPPHIHSPKHFAASGVTSPH